MILGFIKKKMLGHADRVNDYFCNAVTVYGVLDDDDAELAVLAAAKVAGSQQRQSMVEYLRGLGSDMQGRFGGDDGACIERLSICI